ncbi:hypothetical protein FA893_11635 [Photobacterium damselae subsp. piscicida]|uniref:hypothetical protein n=1 Tax=Photobacterium damselae TaxID=38293 RepID=UPI0005C65D26|nr:hypothetical protein [Photobacterium damselae]OLQ80774.1 hypothetical protein BEI67_12425 [Photobacterium damselae subsp. piscicida]TFZ56343.1 hypothetical protein E4T25_12410 [Photobacterium damselae subsp. piscicida]TJZ89902.1 hypothetical protein FA893_11635 [Photobacterium damselae subsp. piscicida]BBC40495.1 hypothetical protein PDPE_1-01335 [Photobacterium damselae subsp. piscicida]
MNKRENTLLALEAALDRIIQDQTKRIPKTRKLSVRAVEEEANLGNGTSYYYPEFIEKIKKSKAEMATTSDLTPRSYTDRLRAKAMQEVRIKEKYKKEKIELKEVLARMAAEHHHINDALRKALARVDELELENHELKKELVKTKRASITNIK